MEVEGEGVTATSAAGEEAYQHFLTAVYGILDGQLDASRFESECADLMGTSAFTLYTFDKLAQSAAKQLVAMVHELLSQKLVMHWQYMQARINLAGKTRTAAECEWEGAAVRSSSCEIQAHNND